MSKLTSDSVSKTLIRMAIPMLAGTFSLNAYNLTDTWFVSRLGTNALAAMSFTFPVVMLLGFVMRGVITGAMALVAHALGGRRHERAARLTTHAIFLISIISVVITTAGLISMKALFARLGATGEILLMTRQYMGIWYCGLILLGIHVLLGDIIMGSGNTTLASLLMVSGTAINFILDPIMIFGLMGFPEMGIRGAALATVLSEMIVMAIALYIIHRKLHLLTPLALSMNRMLISWRRILRLGIPSIFGWILTPISSAIIIRIVVGFGESAVAACGVAGRIEMFAFMIPMTVGMSIVPFVAQNFGARHFDRILSARRGTMIFAMGFGFFIAIIFLIVIRPIAALFSSDEKVISVLVHYIRVTCLGYGFIEVFRYAGFFMTGMHQTKSTALLNTTRALFLLIPLSLIGAYIFGLTGVFAGRLVSDILAGSIGFFWSGRVIRNQMLK
ncbi:MAG: Multidrug export protein MepA [candidate division BRC1 bacterium ADurb.Bin183]|nr:MAG: Multidrug export protein MepA [candidate division BRC1 bacterium ADurb.Bin183]